MLGPLADEGWLVLHDVTLPGWLDGLEHPVVGPSGVWVVKSWQRPRRLPGRAAPAEILLGLCSQADAVAAVLDRGVRVLVRGLLCVRGAWSGPTQLLQGVRVMAPRRPAVAIRRRSSTPSPVEVERASTRLLEALRPAA